MRSEIRFVMSPEDETEFIRFVKSETGTVFVDGPNWHQPRPVITNEPETAGRYLMIWNPLETPELAGTHHHNEDKEWWYCNNTFLAIQFLRSDFQYGDPFLIEGRIAVCTTCKDHSLFHPPSATAIENRFKALRKYIKKSYTNSRIIWQSITLPRSKTNPLKPDSSLWVGPHAMFWLEQEPKNRWVQQFRTGLARGYLLDLVD